jgi:hypothetical protein
MTIRGSVQVQEFPLYGSINEDAESCLGETGHPPLPIPEIMERGDKCRHRLFQNQGAKDVSGSKKQQGDHHHALRAQRSHLGLVVLVQMACFSLLFPICDSFQAAHPFISGPILRTTPPPNSTPIVGSYHHHRFLHHSHNQATAWPSSGASQAAMLRRMNKRLYMQSQGGESSKRPILLIGGTGRVGGFVAQGLVARGERVRALVRDVNSPRCQALKEACRGARGEIEIVEGDVAKFATVERAMAGCRACIACHGSVRGTNFLKDSAYKIWDPSNMFLGE